eukprot:2150593-Rhodomonas_salina.1
MREGGRMVEEGEEKEEGEGERERERERGERRERGRGERKGGKRDEREVKGGKAGRGRERREESAWRERSGRWERRKGRERRGEGRYEGRVDLEGASFALGRPDEEGQVQRRLLVAAVRQRVERLEPLQTQAANHPASRHQTVVADAVMGRGGERGGGGEVVRWRW